MINVSKDSVFNLKPIGANEIRPEIQHLIADNEQIISAFKTIRDQVIFTDFRIITVDLQGLTGTRVSYTSLFYATIQYFSIQTPGLIEFPTKDSEMYICFSNGFTADFEFKGAFDIFNLTKQLSKYVKINFEKK